MCFPKTIKLQMKIIALESYAKCDLYIEIFTAHIYFLTLLVVIRCSRFLSSTGLPNPYYGQICV